MPEAAAKILFVGDIHLGRRPTGLVEQLESRGLSPHELSPARAFATTVRLAIESKVDAVVLAGDVVESEKDRFEGYSHLERGTRRLVEAGIKVYGVSGNHDAIVLPRLATRIPGFDLIGREGEWQTRELTARSGMVVQLLGWSFTKNHHSTSPFQHPSWLPMQQTLSGVTTPVLGVLHCDLDMPGSPYAPVRLSELEAAPVDAFFLGHVHQPAELSGARPIGYLGSLVGLDAGEPGARGPWLVEVRGPGDLSATQLAVGPIRWERLELAMDGVEVDEIEDRILDAFDDCKEQLGATLGADVRAVGCRVTLSGHTAARGRLESFVAETRSQALVKDIGGVLFFLEKTINETSPPLDLEREAEGQTPLSLLAKEILHLEAEDETENLLLARVEREVQDVLARYWRHLPGGDVVPDARALVRAAAARLLDEMLSTSPGAREQERER